MSRVTSSAFWPPVDDSGKLKVEDILDSRFVHFTRHLTVEFLVKWFGMIFLKPFVSLLLIYQTALMCFSHFASIQGYPNLEGGSNVRF